MCVWSGGIKLYKAVNLNQTIWHTVYRSGQSRSAFRRTHFSKPFPKLPSQGTMLCLHILTIHSQIISGICYAYNYWILELWLGWGHGYLDIDMCGFSLRLWFNKPSWVGAHQWSMYMSWECCKLPFVKYVVLLGIMVVQKKLQLTLARPTRQIKLPTLTCSLERWFESADDRQ